MTPSPRSRDRFRLGVSSATALVTAASLTAVGWFAGSAAREHEAKLSEDDAARAVAEAKAARARATYEAAVAAAKSASFSPRVILRPRPHRTVVHTRYVASAAAPVTVGGGSVSAPVPAAPPPQVTQQAPVVHAPPPPPPPPPAPTSGS